MIEKFLITISHRILSLWKVQLLNEWRRRIRIARKVEIFISNIWRKEFAQCSVNNTFRLDLLWIISFFDSASSLMKNENCIESLACRFTFSIGVFFVKHYVISISLSFRACVRAFFYEKLKWKTTVGTNEKWNAAEESSMKIASLAANQRQIYHNDFEKWEVTRNMKEYTRKQLKSATLARKTWIRKKSGEEQIGRVKIFHVLELRHVFVWIIFSLEFMRFPPKHTQRSGCECVFACHDKQKYGDECWKVNSFRMCFRSTTMWAKTCTHTRSTKNCT